MIEVMVAVLLTAIAASGIIGLYMAETRASGFSRHHTEATVLAQDQMERLRTLGAVASGSNAVTLNEHGKEVVGGLYTRTWVVTPTVPPTYEDLSVTVTWEENDELKTVTLTSRRSPTL